MKAPVSSRPAVPSVSPRLATLRPFQFWKSELHFVLLVGYAVLGYIFAVPQSRAAWVLWRDLKEK